MSKSLFKNSLIHIKYISYHFLKHNEKPHQCDFNFCFITKKVEVHNLTLICHTPVPKLSKNWNAKLRSHIFYYCYRFLRIE